MARVPISGPDACLAIIDRFVGRAASDAIILDASEAALARRGQVRLQVVQIEIEADVAVEVAVARVARVTGVPAPHLAGGIRSEEDTSEIQSLRHLVCRLLLEKKKK